VSRFVSGTSTQLGYTIVPLTSDVMENTGQKTNKKTHKLNTRLILFSINHGRQTALWQNCTLWRTSSFADDDGVHCLHRPICQYIHKPMTLSCSTSAYTPGQQLLYNIFLSAVLIDWAGFKSPPTQYRLYGRRFLQVRRPNQQYL